jgi:hypothetical protein
MPVRLAVVGVFALLGYLWLSDAFTDAATRIAFDIESGVSGFRHANATATTIAIKPKAHPSGCAGAYRVQLSSALVVWCFDANGKVSGSHLTSYHGRFIDTPQTFIVDKPAGTPLYIDLEKRGDRIVAVGLH